jgi:hypothetical protein
MPTDRVLIFNANYLRMGFLDQRIRSESQFPKVYQVMEVCFIKLGMLMGIVSGCSIALAGVAGCAYQDTPARRAHSAPGSKIQITAEPPGPNCENGGQRIDVGTVVHGDLHIQQTAYVCNGVVGTVPLYPPTSLTFLDQDPTLGNIQGTVKIGRATDESNITMYQLYWGSDAMTRLMFITTLPKTSTDLTYFLKGVVPLGATHLLAFTANDVGEMTSGVAFAVVDNFPVYTDISAGQAYSG